jgi:ABC-type cobalamin/Fe3+-siderophores transport system ATPase subunit
VAPDIPVKIAQTQEVGGHGPIVILGPNGSGKTRHAISMLGWNDAEMVAALRNIALSENIGMQPLAQAVQHLTQFFQRRRSRHWELSNEIDQLFSKLMAEDSSSAVSFRDAYLKGNTTEPERTKLTILQEMWERLFPGRQISFADYSPKVRSALAGTDADYSAQQMSDGERVAVYLAARILDASKPILIIDEPETHFHCRLAVRFWNEVEDMRSDARLVYVTHDLSFALSRRDATYVILKSTGNPSVVELQEGVPSDLAKSLLSAASFSIHAQRVVFCEGEEGKSYDYDLYSSWFDNLETAVVPVGNCRDVAETVDRFTKSTLIAGLSAIGIVDRDYWPVNFLDGLVGSVHVLPVHEIENLLCNKGLFTAVAKHLGKDNPEALFEDFLGKAKARFCGDLLIYQVSERFKRRSETEFLTARNALKPKASMEDTKAHYEQSLNPSGWQTPPSNLFQAEKDAVENALNADGDDFLRIFPGKVFFNQIETVLGIKPKAYVDLVCQSLRASRSTEDHLHALGKEVESVLESLLPPREESEEEASP